MPNKIAINITIDEKLVKYIDSHFKIPGTNWSRSNFIEACIKDKVTATITPKDHLKNELKFHEEKERFHSDIAVEISIKLKRMEGQLKLVPTKVYKELKNNSDKLTSYEEEKEQDVKDMMEHAPLHKEIIKGGAIVGQDISKKELEKKALEIIKIKE